MEFNEEKAREIIARYGLDEKTIRVWRSRKKIPEKYNKKGYKPRVLSKAGGIKHDRFVHVLDSKAFNINVLAELSGVAEHKIKDALRKGKKQVRLSDDDLQACINEIKRVKIEIAHTFEKYSPLKLKKLFSNPLLRYSVIVPDKELRYNISYIRSGKNEADKNIYDEAKDFYIRFAITLNI